MRYSNFDAVLDLKETRNFNNIENKKFNWFKKNLAKHYAQKQSVLLNDHWQLMKDIEKNRISRKEVLNLIKEAHNLGFIKDIHLQLGLERLS